MQIELYINNQLCDIGNPSDFSVYLKRVFINPAELTTKDAQKSYNITLPASARNNIVFGFSNIEEVKGKFVKIYDAYLIVGGVKIFNGKFRLSEITSNSYSGNLGIPANKTIKDIFGDRTMTEAGAWLVPFQDDFFEAIKEYNDIEGVCFFPLALYGLLPKTKEGDEYTDKTIFDNTVALGMFDFPPSINCIETIKKIFDNEDLTLSGTALTDSKLTKLFMSYKNPVDYDMKWNYRSLLSLDVSGNWESYDNAASGYGFNTEKYTATFDIMKNRRSGSFDINENKGDLLKGNPGDRYIYIPGSGVYEIDLDVTVTLDKGETWDADYLRLARELFLFKAGNNNLTDTTAIEVKLLRFSDGNNNYSEIDIDRKFGENNIKQDVANWDYGFPKYFPEEGGTMVVDQSQSDRFISGIGFGYSDLATDESNHYTCHANPMIGRNGYSWDSSFEQINESYITTQIPGYRKADLVNGSIVFSTSDYNKRDILNLNNTASILTSDKGTGNIKCYVYLNKGERLKLITTSKTLHYKTNNPFENLKEFDIIFAYNIAYSLKVKPVMYDKEFVNGDIDANNINSDILKDNIDLSKFLPSDIKINDWLDNFCKAFNLSLIQSDNGGFELNTPQKEQSAIGSIIDLDNRCSIIARKNTPLGLPSVYDIGFTINQEEEGYIRTGDNGGGQYETGSIDGDTLTQTSAFSYNWFKSILFENDNVSYNIPVITNSEIWEPLVRDYEEMMSKTYFDLAQRFWYRDGNINITYGRQTITLGKVSNSVGGMILNYKNNPASILNNYFTVFVNSDANFTTVECFLTPDEYYKLPCLVRLNGDLYNVADIDGYDPLGKKKATLKLIRKIK